MDTPFLQQRRALAVFTSASVAASLAACTAAVFRVMFHEPDADFALLTGAPTLCVGFVWAWLLRSQRKVGSTSIGLGWAMSVPLAALNGALSAGLLLAIDGHRGGSLVEVLGRFLSGAALGLTLGAMFWLPSMVVTLVLFGVPLAAAERLARKGLAGRERGDRIVGLSSALLGAGALLFTLRATMRQGTGLAVVALLAAVGVLSGLTSAALAWQRERARRAFVREVEAGRVERFRVDDTPEGRVLVRVVRQGQGYRVADYEEEIAALDREGAVTGVSRARS